MTEKFKLKGEYRELAYKAFKKAGVWAFIAGMAAAKAVGAYGDFKCTYSIAAVSQLANDAGVLPNLIEECKKYHR